MPVKIIKFYKGTNLFKAELASGQKVYGYRWTFEGHKFTRAKWQTKEEAETALSKFKLKMRNPNRLDYEDVEISLSMLLDAWELRANLRGISKKRISETKRYINLLIEVATTDKVKRLSEEDLLLYQRARLALKKPRHNHTINKELAMIRTVLRAASFLFPGFNWQPPNVANLPELHKGREALLSRSQLKDLLLTLREAANTENQVDQLRFALAFDAVMIGIETAMRISEIAGLQKTQVHFERGIGFKHGYLVVYSAKTKKHETIPMTRNVAAILKNRFATNPGKYLFKLEGQHNNPIGQKIRRAMKEACEKLGITYGMENDGVVFHTIRHSTTTELIVNQKIPIPTVMKITRHSSRTMILRYTHPTASAIEEAIEHTEINLDDDREKGEEKTS